MNTSGNRVRWWCHAPAAQRCGTKRSHVRQHTTRYTTLTHAKMRYIYRAAARETESEQRAQAPKCSDTQRTCCCSVCIPQRRDEPRACACTCTAHANMQRNRTRAPKDRIQCAVPVSAPSSSSTRFAVRNAILKLQRPFAHTRGLVSLHKLHDG